MDTSTYSGLLLSKGITTERDRIIEQYILRQSTWDSLPEGIKKMLDNSKDNWRHEIINYSLRYQIKWRENALIRSTITDERQYYLDLIKHATSTGSPYPYHLAEVLMRGLRTTPGRYYSDLFHDLITNDKSAESMPKITLLDCCDYFGVTNDVLISSVSKLKIQFKSSGKNPEIKESLPKPIFIDIPYWWVANVGFVSDTDIKECSETEHSVIDSLIVRGSTLAGELDKDAVHSLFRKGFIFLDVPINNHDIITLDNTVSTTVFKDKKGNSWDKLLEVFVEMISKEEGSMSVADIVQYLAIDAHFVKRVLSLFCRVKLLVKRAAPLGDTESILQLFGSNSLVQSKWHSSWSKPQVNKTAVMETQVLDDGAIDKLLLEIKELTENSQNFQVDENKLWDMLNFIERWERTRADSSQYRERLAELRATLLKLIPKVSSEEEIKNSTSVENELANFDDSFKLVLNTGNWGNLMENSSKKLVSNIISVCGDTHCGKSTIIGALLREANKDGKCPDVAAPQQLSPTTANVQYYDSGLIENVSKIRFLDLEGENGGQPPRNSLSLRLDALLALMGITEYQEKRRKAVSESIPRLAFVTSDIVLFIGNESFANANYMTRVRKLVYDATESVDSAHSPALILVYNKCSLDEEFDVDICTKQFFQNVENLEIKKLYNDVKCFCIPHFDQVKKVRAPGKPTLLIDGEEIFSLQVQKLHKLIQDMISERMALREINGTLFSESVWCLLFRSVIDNFDTKLRMADLLCTIIKPKDVLSNRAFEFFRGVYSYVHIFRKEQYLRCRESALQMLACLYVDHMKVKQQEFDKWIIGFTKSENFKYEMYRVFSEFVTHAANLEPCEAIYPYESQGSIMCTTERMCHGLNHRSSQKAFSPSSDPNMLTRVFQNFSAWFKIGYMPIWEGNHQFQYPHSHKEEFARFTHTTQILSKVSPSSYFLTKISILQKSLCQVYPTQARHIMNWNSEMCWICLINFPDRILLPCRHVICGECYDRLVEITPDQVPITMEVLSLDERISTQVVEEVGPILKSNCPICRSPYFKVADNQAGRRQQLKNRLISLVENNL